MSPSRPQTQGSYTLYKAVFVDTLRYIRIQKFRSANVGLPDGTSCHSILPITQELTIARLLRLTRTPVRLEDATRTLKHNNCQNIRGETLARDKSTLVKSLASNSGTLQNSTTKRDNVQTSDPFISASCFSRTQIYINRRYSADSSLRSLQSEYGKFYADLENFVGDLPEKYKIAAPYPLHYVELIPTVLKPNDPGFVAGNMQEIVLKLLYVQGTTEAVLGKAFPFVREEENKWFQDQSERLQSRLLGVMHELRSLPCDHDGKSITLCAFLHVSRFHPL